jgi:hypothetical protein
VDQEQQEFERLQEIARSTRAAFDAATTDEQRHTLLTEVLVTTVALVNHEVGIPKRRKEVRDQETARRWRRLARGGLAVLAVTAVVTLIAPWVSDWWLILPGLLASGCALMLVDTEIMVRQVRPDQTRLVEVLGGIGVLVGVLTTLLVPLLPHILRVAGPPVAVLAMGAAVAIAIGPLTNVPGRPDEHPV